MPNIKLTIQPGVNAQLTETANSAGISQSNLIRWRMGLLERMAGWARLFEQTCANFVRAMHAYQDLSLNNTLLLGTDGGPQIFVDGVLYDFSLVRRSVDLTPPFYSFAAASSDITVTDSTHGALDGELVNFPVTLAGAPDSVTFSASNTDAIIWADVATSGTLFVAAGTAGGFDPAVIYTAPPGGTWTSRTSNLSGANRLPGGVAYGTSTFVVVSSGGAIVTAPADGVTWTPRTSNVSADLFGVCWSGTTFIAVGNTSGGNTTVTVSSNGTVWTDRSFANASGLAFVAVASNGAGVVIAVGILTSSGQAGIYKSTDNGATWAQKTAPQSFDPSICIAYAGGLFVAGGSQGRCYTSSDNGETWVQRATNLGSGSSSASAVGYAGNQWYLAAPGGLLATSDAGFTWVSHGTTIAGTPNGFAYASDQLVTGATGLYQTTNVVSRLTPPVPAGFYNIGTVLSADTYTVDIGSPSAATGSTGGYPAVYAINFPSGIGSTTARAYLQNHGKTVGATWDVGTTITFPVNGVTLSGSYTITAVPNSYTVEFDTAQGTATSLFESVPANGGLGPIQYYRASPTIPQNWFLDNLGENGLITPTNGPIYVYQPPVPDSGIVSAESIATGPKINSGMFVAMPQAQIIAFGSEAVIDGGTQDPLLVRYSDAGSYEIWTATSTNQAGSYRLSRGSRIVGGIQAPQSTLLWTDIDIWSMQYIGGSLVYSFTVVGTGCGLISPKARAIQGRNTFWMTRLGFYMYGDGGVVPLNCTVWDEVFQNLDDSPAALNKIHAGANSSNNEVMWFYCSSSSSGEIDSYVKFNTQNQLWDYGSLCRTAWIDESVFGTALGADQNYRIQQHEIGFNADGEPMAGAFVQTGRADLQDGSYILLLDRIWPDFKFLGEDGSVTLTVYTWPAPEGQLTTHGPYPVTPNTPAIPVRARARQVALRIDWATDTDFNARLGTPMMRVSPSGRT